MRTVCAVVCEAETATMCALTSEGQAAVFAVLGDEERDSLALASRIGKQCAARMKMVLPFADALHVAIYSPRNASQRVSWNIGAVAAGIPSTRAISKAALPESFHEATEGMNDAEAIAYTLCAEMIAYLDADD